jgi:hypothetical protein
MATVVGCFILATMGFMKLRGWLEADIEKGNT